VVPFATTEKMSAAIVPGATLISYPGLPHGMPVTRADRINADLFAVIEG
jgi:non-heme chloroperoxidase